MAGYNDTRNLIIEALMDKQERHRVVQGTRGAEAGCL